MTRSEQITKESRSLFPGGVNSPVRSFASVGCEPLVFDRGEGAYLWDVDQNRYLDFCSSWGPLILGHRHPVVAQKLQVQMEKAWTFGAHSQVECELGRLVREWNPHIEKMRFVSSGTEATMSAIRLARAFTKRTKIVKCEGCYHGHVDSLLVKAGSGLATFGMPSSAGVPENVVADTLVVPYNDSAALKAVFQKYGNEIAAVIVEGVPANMGLILPLPGYLETMQSLAKTHGSVFICDEVISGFRLAQGGATSTFKLQPDLCTYGKILGGGFPAALYGGRADIMAMVSPDGPMYQAGTLSGNPVAMAAGLATLHVMQAQDGYALLEQLGQHLDACVKQQLTDVFPDVKYARLGSIFGFYFGVQQVPRNFSEISASRMDIFNNLYVFLLKQGIYLGPSGYEVSFLSTAHTKEHISYFVGKIAEFFRKNPNPS